MMYSPSQKMQTSIGLQLEDAKGHRTPIISVDTAFAVYVALELFGILVTEIDCLAKLAEIRV
jgi:hypothetical protein